MSEAATRPVLALLRALDDLDAHARDASYAGRGPARRRAFNAKNRMPPGALDAEGAAAIATRWRAHFDDEIPPPEATSAPTAEVATTYWLASGDREGTVLRARLERLPPRRKPWSELWPCMADAAATCAAEDALRRAASLLRFHPSEPLLGWHRAVPAEGEPDAWREQSIEGRSLCAPIAIMLLSSWLERPLDPTIAVTGDLDADLRLALPGDSRDAVLAKVTAVQRERACIKTVLVPRGTAPRLDPRGRRVDVVEVTGLREVAERFGLSFAEGSPRPQSVPGWMQAVEEAEWLIRARAVDVPVMRARLLQLDDVSEDLASIAWGEGGRPRALDAARLALLGRLCGYHAHGVDAPRAEAVSRRIDDLLVDATRRGAGLPLATMATVRNVQASMLIDVHRFETARRYAAEAYDAATTSRDGAAAARIASTRGRIEAHAGDDAQALRLLDVAMAELEENIPWETNLCACYRVGALGRLGRWDAAHEALLRAIERAKTAPGVTPGWRSDNALYLDYEALKLALRQGDVGAALGALQRCEAAADARTRGPWPASGIAVRGIDAFLRAGSREAAVLRWDRLRALADAHPAALLRVDLGRGAALFIAADLTAGRSIHGAHRLYFEAYLGSIPDGEASPLRAPRDACRSALGEGRTKDLVTTIAALLEKEIY